MVFREVSVIEIREVLRSWLAGGLRTAATQAGVDRKTARRYVEAAVTASLARDGVRAVCSRRRGVPGARGPRGQGRMARPVTGALSCGARCHPRQLRRRASADVAARRCPLRVASSLCRL
jgi:hypothetical protein